MNTDETDFLMMMNTENKLPKFVIISRDVTLAMKNHQPVVALESTVITHGLPQPENLVLARAMESEVRQGNAVPATIAILNGKVHIGLSDAELELLASKDTPSRKVSRRDFGLAIAGNFHGGTTVAGTLITARLAGIRVFATGGIGGVHRGGGMDISADLAELGRTPLVVVCSGAKAILDLPATREYLETSGVPVLGYRTDEFPAFYCTSSGLKVDGRVDSAQEVVRIARAQWEMGIASALLVTNPPPSEAALPADVVEKAIEQALAEAKEKGIHGAAVTPFLLSRISQITGGESLRANLALLKSNARLAAEIAVEFARGERKYI